MDVLDQHTLADAIGTHSAEIIRIFEDRSELKKASS